MDIYLPKGEKGRTIRNAALATLRHKTLAITILFSCQSFRGGAFEFDDLHPRLSAQQGEDGTK